MSKKVSTDDIPQGKFRVVEQLVKERREVHLGDFDSFEEAENHVKKTFKSRKAGWFGYFIHNDKGTLCFSATATKKKEGIFTKSTFSSETFSFR